MDEAVVALDQVVGDVQDVVDEIARGGDLEVGDGSVVVLEAALVVVKLEEPVHPGVLLELELLRQDEDDLELIRFAFVHEVLPFLRIFYDVPRHPGGEEPARDQLLQAGHALQAEVGEQRGVGEVDLVPVVGVQPGALVLGLVVERLLGDVSSYKSCHQLKRKGNKNSICS